MVWIWVYVLCKKESAQERAIAPLKTVIDYVCSTKKMYILVSEETPRSSDLWGRSNEPWKDDLKQDQEKL